MRTITIEKELFKFEELSHDAQEKVKEWYLEGQEACYFSDNLKEDLKGHYGIDYGDIVPYFSLGYCQGDGLCLSGELYVDNLSEKLRKIFFKGLSKRQREIIAEDVMRIDFNHRGNYYYADSTKIELVSDEIEIHERAYEKFLDNVQEWYDNTCAEYEEWGYDYFYEISDEDLKEHCDVNDYEFYEDGSFAA